MVKLKISYKRPEELEEVKRLLEPALRSCRKARNQNGEYYRAYMYLKDSFAKSQEGGSTDGKHT